MENRLLEGLLKLREDAEQAGRMLDAGAHLFCRQRIVVIRQNVARLLADLYAIGPDDHATARRSRRFPIVDSERKSSRFEQD